MIFNERWKSLRVRNGVMQKNIALQLFEYGTVKPQLDTVIKLADLFNMFLDYLVGRITRSGIMEVSAWKLASRSIFKMICCSNADCSAKL